MRRRLFGRGRAHDRPAPTDEPDAPCVECADKDVRPFGLVVPPEPVVAPDDVLARVPGRLETVVGGQLLVFDPLSGNAHLLNTSAALVLSSVDGRARVADIADELSRETGVDRDVMQRDVTDVLGTLVHGGLVTWFFHYPSEPAQPSGSGHGTSSTRWQAVVERRLDSVSWPQVADPVLAGGAPVVVRTDDAELASLLADATRSLPAAPAGTAAASTLSIDLRLVSGRERFRVHAGGRRVGWIDDRRDAVAYALSGLNRLAVDHTRGQLLVHAGVLERDGRVAMLTGPSGRGKSTLTAASVRSGAAYVSDELAIVDPVTRAVTPYAKALELDDDAVARLGLSDDPRVAATGAREHHVPPAALGRVSSGGTLALVVLLDAPAAGPPVPTELAPADAMLRLLPDVLPETWAVPGALDALAELCERVPTVVLPRLDLPEAVAVVGERLAAG